MHEVIRVLNVGQGDSILVKPYLPDTVLLIDTGPLGSNVARHIADERIHLVITHHHADHMGGLKDLIRAKGSKIKKFYLPAQHNELVLITRAILNLKSRGLSKDSNSIFSLFESMEENQFVIADGIKGLQDLEVRFLYDGARIGDHVTCLNPPSAPRLPDWANEIGQAGFYRMLRSLFHPDFANYLFQQLFPDNTILRQEETNDLKGREPPFVTPTAGEGTFSINTNFVLQFLISTMDSMDLFNRDPSYANALRVYQSYTAIVHDCCIVLNALSGPDSVLLTSDASKKVFTRLLREHKLEEVTMLQIPHHGSARNMDAAILDQINPRAVFISHGNRRFGRSGDSHPHWELLNLLLERDLDIMLTNDVIKKEVVILQKANHSLSPSPFFGVER